MYLNNSLNLQHHIVPTYIDVVVQGQLSPLKLIDMDGFKIFTSKGVDIPINTLDAEVAELWNFKPQSDKEYAKLKSRDEFAKDAEGEFEYSKQLSWYDTIGYLISQGMSFNCIIEYYTEYFKDFLGKKDKEGVEITLDYIMPKEMLLLTTWMQKDYVPMSVE